MGSSLNGKYAKVFPEMFNMLDNADEIDLDMERNFLHGNVAHDIFKNLKRYPKTINLKEN